MVERRQTVVTAVAVEARKRRACLPIDRHDSLPAIRPHEIIEFGCCSLEPEVDRFARLPRFPYFRHPVGEGMSEAFAVSMRVQPGLSIAGRSFSRRACSQLSGCRRFQTVARGTGSLLHLLQRFDDQVGVDDMSGIERMYAVGGKENNALRSRQRLAVGVLLRR